MVAPILRTKSLRNMGLKNKFLRGGEAVGIMKVEFEKYYVERTGRSDDQAFWARRYREHPKSMEWAYGKTEGLALSTCEREPVVIALEDLEVACG